jgi:hypothetical protein
MIGGSTQAHDRLVSACCTWLKLHHIAHTRINQKPHRQRDGTWRNQGADPGAPDIIACHLGRCYVLEVKTGSAKPTPVQLLSAQQWTIGGAIAKVVRDVADLDLVFGMRRPAAAAPLAD